MNTLPHTLLPQTTVLDKFRKSRYRLLVRRSKSQLSPLKSLLGLRTKWKHSCELAIGTLSKSPRSTVCTRMHLRSSMLKSWLNYGRAEMLAREAEVKEEKKRLREEQRKERQEEKRQREARIDKRCWRVATIRDCRGKRVQG